MPVNRTARLKHRPKGQIARDIFDFRDEPLADPGEGQFRVRAEYLSLDPAMRGWMSEGRSYVRPVELGEVMRAYSVGHIDASRHREFNEGDAVVGLFGVQSYAISDGRGVIRADTSLAPLPTWLGGLGMPGLTAYFGLLEVASPKSGDTVVVSAASGAVGQVVGQIARLRGCRAVGIAGGPEKCNFITSEIGFDAAVDYKAGRLAEDLKSACPDGIDVDFENVGGEIFDTVLSQMNPFGRVAVCGLISGYGAAEPPPGPKNIRMVLVMRLRVQGFIVFDFAERYGEALADLGRWHQEGRIKFREDVREGGIDAFPETLNLLYTGGNFGKLVLKL
ncbi:MAG TPA: NADP-dependent oxidoreductase [Aestuariivirgaceae bacterium]|nr:NADP-dependent oxidoreductase [Aestuariivirgaceae bacterium]